MSILKLQTAANVLLVKIENGIKFNNLCNIVLKIAGKRIKLC